MSKHAPNCIGGSSTGHIHFGLLVRVLEIVPAGDIMSAIPIMGWDREGFQIGSYDVTEKVG